MTTRILTGDCREVLRTLPDESVHCVVTSPPYWGLRDYGVDGQLGMEPTYQEHVDAMAAVFDEVRRVLRSDGTLWLNYGDSYAAHKNGRSAADTKAAGNDDRTFRDKPFSTVSRGWNKGNIGGDFPNAPNRSRQAVLKPKDLCGMPWRVAFALQERGWWLRQDIIWSKPNPMPESIRDRCTKSHEYLFLLAKSERYYFDAKAILEPVSPNTHARLSQDVAAQVGSARAHAGGKTNGNMKAVGRGPKTSEAGSGIKNNDSFAAAVCLPVTHRNKRSVWTVTTQPFSEAHFATFPPALIEPCILAGCPEGGTVLDPFGGAGTTGLVADRLGRNAILIELNPEYVAITERRLRADAPLFSDVATTPSGAAGLDAPSNVDGDAGRRWKAGTASGPEPVADAAP